MTSERTAVRKSARGRVDFRADPGSESLAIHVDRVGFRRLLRTLERLAETGKDQRFERSGRQRRKGRNGAGEAGLPISTLVFHIDGEGTD